MLRLRAVLLLLLLGAAVLDTNGSDQGRHKLCLNTGWRFHLGDPNAAFYAQDLDASGWELVSVPHTLKLTSLALDGCPDDKTQPTFHRTVGWYRREVRVTADRQRKVFLEFEGVHQVTDVWVNGRHVGQHAVGGYTPFHFDISDFVVRGAANQVTVRADNRRREDVPPDPGPFDYVKFSGLYRDVYLVETDPLHIPFNWEALDAGIFITTPTVDPVNRNAVIDCKTVVRNERPQSQAATVVTRVMDRRGVVVLKLEQSHTIASGRDRVFKQIGAIEDDLHLWSVDDPYLYRVRTTVLANGKVVDAQENRLGIRKFQLDPVRGFLLNEKPIELIGFNRHQHYGFIGDAVPNSLHYKDMWQFKQLGLNVVRTAHYPQDNALLEACDELGILVYEEAPTWISISQDPRWYANLEAATRAMIRNHRNHPSVVIWGAGINHRGYVPRSVLACKQEDPTRLTASQNSRWTGWQSSGLSDVFANMMYGPGLWDRSEPLLAMEGGRGARAVGSYLSDPLKTGLISWTAHAYYTFHLGPKLKNRTRSGMMTIFREPKRGLMWYPAELTKEPFLHIEDAWKEGLKTLTVYANTEEVELRVNGKPFRRGKPSEDPAYAGLNHPPFHFQIDRFESGTLEARGLTGGQVVVKQTIRTPEEPDHLELVLDTAAREFVADGSDILVGYAHIVDRNGTTVPDASYDVTFAVEGPASIVGDGLDIGANPFPSRRGASPVLLRAGTTPGRITVTASADGLRPGAAHVTTIARNDDALASLRRPVYDFERVRVDLGAADQLVQFDWTPWNGVDRQSSSKEFAALGGFSASLKPASPEGELRWLGENNVIGKYGYAYGEGVIALDPDGLDLEFAGLPQGLYRLRTWHHAPRAKGAGEDPDRNRPRSLSIARLPYAPELTIQVADAGRNARLTTPVTVGKERQTEPVAVAECLLESDGRHSIRVRFRDPERKRGIWLNAFELSQWAGLFHLGGEGAEGNLFLEK